MAAMRGVQTMPPIVVEGKEATLLDLDLFLALRRGPLPVAELAQRLALRADRAPALFDALAAEGLLERRGDRYANAAEIEERFERSEVAATGPRLLLLLAPMLCAALAALCVLILMPGAHRGPGGAPPPTDAAAAAPAQAQPYSSLPDPIFYLVQSQRQAYLVDTGAFSGGLDFWGGPVVVSRSIDEAVQARTAEPGTVTIDVVATSDDEEATRTLIAKANAIRAVRGERTIYVVDLQSLFDLPSPAAQR
jgi:hypothetical protein